jgi:hypothetical protein
MLHPSPFMIMLDANIMLITEGRWCVWPAVRLAGEWQPHDAGVASCLPSSSTQSGPAGSAIPSHWLRRLATCWRLLSRLHRRFRTSSSFVCVVGWMPGGHATRAAALLVDQLMGSRAVEGLWLLI